ncbi:hypothetical protein AcW1_009596 [Taiwanofungus camphoratus]|nr:hypothetical protein AcW1_009596 [Antrodia cinnamomea]
MAVLMPHQPTLPPPTKRRRTATSVLAGDFDARPARDVLTSLLNGVPVYTEVEHAEEVRRGRRRREKQKEREKEREREREREARRARAPAKPPQRPVPAASTSSAPPPAASAHKRPALAPAAPRPTTSSFWQARPTIHIATMQRSVSVTPPPMPSSPPTTPGPSISSTTSASSSKRPHTPDDGEELNSNRHSIASATPPPAPPQQQQQQQQQAQQARKKRTAVRKGWKGWVEGSPPPSEKLINLDVVTVLSERKTRSGKNFDAIGVGKEGWVSCR